MDGYPSPTIAIATAGDGTAHGSHSYRWRCRPAFSYLTTLVRFSMLWDISHIVGYEAFHILSVAEPPTMPSTFMDYLKLTVRRFCRVERSILHMFYKGTKKDPIQAFGGGPPKKEKPPPLPPIRHNAQNGTFIGHFGQKWHL